MWLIYLTGERQKLNSNSSLPHNWEVWDFLCSSLTVFGGSNGVGRVLSLSLPPSVQVFCVMGSWTGDFVIFTA